MDSDQKLITILNKTTGAASQTFTPEELELELLLFKEEEKLVQSYLYMTHVCRRTE